MSNYQEKYKQDKFEGEKSILNPAWREYLGKHSIYQHYGSILKEPGAHLTGSLSTRFCNSRGGQKIWNMAFGFHSEKEGVFVNDYHICTSALDWISGPSKYYERDYVGMLPLYDRGNHRYAYHWLKYLMQDSMFSHHFPYKERGPCP